MLDKNTQPARTFDEKTITWLYKLCSQAEAAVEHRHDELKALEAQLAPLAPLQRRTCTGKVHWRDKDSAAKMIILHSVGKSCPLHGQPNPGKRIRSYVGTDQGKQAGANQAVKNEEKRVRLQRERNCLASKLHSAGYALCEFYRLLDYPAPKFSETGKNPEAKERG